MLQYLNCSSQPPHIHSTSLQLDNDNDNRPFIFIAPLSPYHSEACSRLLHEYCIEVSRQNAQATVSEGLAQGPYMVARAGVEPMTLWLGVIDFTKAPPCLAARTP